MNSWILLAADLVAITVLTYVLYLRRHRRRDLAVAYLGVNVGVLAVALALTGSSASLGLGLGLFGVLSIIRLRSTELAQHEVAYYFAALALGLIGGIGVTPEWLGLALMALIVGAMFIGDHPRAFTRYRHQSVVLDRAIGDEQELREALGYLLGGRIHSATVQQLDLVNDKTLVEVRFEAPRASSRPPLPVAPIPGTTPEPSSDATPARGARPGEPASGVVLPSGEEATPASDGSPVPAASGRSAR
ncbi:DUF4956 domain-containing protein [Zafaria sp. Z1313]|uniref:DUF4956 domain-containing protein n=1 Tax=unclassified Zafaria TaxID=2828765 RepID=UPI002E78600A|nr:DUF4956 domain-containing protein [Zafaria sp. J156]MEE1621698.1 DUF4956 domain-containing protein [Zafaria sp. J156]